MKEKKYKHHCLIIGSFRKHYGQIVDIIKYFNDNAIEVLSPRISTVINPEDSFVIFDYDSKSATIREIEDIVLKKMHRADFVYIINPNGYIGLSTSFEIGYCYANNIKVYAMEENTYELCSVYVNGFLKPEEIVAKYQCYESKNRYK